MLSEFDVNIDSFIEETKENEIRENQSQSKNGFQFPTCVGIGNKAIVRFVNGIPSTPVDQGTPGSGRAKLVNINWITDDKGKKHRLILPAIIDNKPQYPSTLVDFINTVTARVWTNYTPEQIEANKGTKLEGKKGKFNYLYEERKDYGKKSSGARTLADIFQFVNKSGHKAGELYYESQKSWIGQTVYIGNVIDRLDPEWHRTNKKTKLLMSKVNLNGDKVTNKEASWFRMKPLTEFVKNHGSKMNYDVLITPQYDGTKEIQNAPYKFYNVSKFKSLNYWDDVRKFLKPEETIPASEDPEDKGIIKVSNTFSDEEKQYDTIDIDKLYKFTSASKILEWVGGTIKEFDEMQGTSFYEKLKTEADEEKENSPKTEKVNLEENSSNVTPKETVTEPIPSTEPKKPNWDELEKVNVNVNESNTTTSETSSITSSIEDFYSSL